MLVIVQLCIYPLMRFLVFLALTIQIAAQLLHSIVKLCKRPDELDEYPAESDQTADYSYKRREYIPCHSVFPFFMP